jgi:hypothetical protein
MKGRRSISVRLLCVMKISELFYFLMGKNSIIIPPSLMMIRVVVRSILHDDSKIAPY